MRAQLASIIAKIAPHDGQERREIDEVASWVESGAPIYRMTAPDDPKQHLISYYVPLDLRGHRVLLGRHRKAGIWLPGGGHVEPDEDPLTCALREMREEIGQEWPLLAPAPFFLSLCETIEQPLVHTDVALWYVVMADGKSIPEFDEREFSQMRWFSWDRLPTKTDRNLARFIEKVEQWRNE